MAHSSEPRWLLLIHEIPPEPAYLRVKVARRLQRIGAVAVKNTVYVLPADALRLEDFQWTVREITSGGGEATVCEASFIEGRTDGEVEALFSAVRRTDYEAIVAEARRLLAELPVAGDPRSRRSLEQGVVKIERRLSTVRAIDFFGAPSATAAVQLVTELSRRLREPVALPIAASTTGERLAYRNRTWVTREGVHVDRMASAWLIRRFIDAAARFKFVSARGYEPERHELRFDMFDAEFTHEGDRCTFEVLLDRMGLEDPALRPIAEIVHDIDLKDGKFARAEAPGIAAVVAAIVLAHPNDDERISRAATLLDELHAWYREQEGER